MSQFSNDQSFTSINDIHDEAIIQHFIDGIGRKVFVLMPSFPFLFIGTIVDVINDLVEIDVETTHYAQLENRLWHVHIHNIEVFYIERDDGPTIPELTNG
ncbi:hypothetical protein [Bacillus sp. AK128]